MIRIYCLKCKDWRDVPGNWYECPNCGKILDDEDNQYAPRSPTPECYKIKENVQKDIEDENSDDNNEESEIASELN